MNRLLGFAGRATDEEVDEVLELAMRFCMRMLSSDKFHEMISAGARLQSQFERFGNG